MTTEFDYILTYNVGPQDFGESTVDPFFPTKKTAVAFFKNLVAREKRKLLKVSMCAHTDNPDELPSWYLEANGKLWDDDLNGNYWQKRLKFSSPISPAKSTIGVDICQQRSRIVL